MRSLGRGDKGIPETVNCSSMKWICSVCGESGCPPPEMYKRHQTAGITHPMSVCLFLRGWILVRKSQGASTCEGNWLCTPRFRLSFHPNFITWGMHTDVSIWILRDGAFSYQSIWPTPLRLHGTTATTPWREILSLLPSEAVEWDTVVPAFPLNFKYKLTYPPCMVITDHPGT